ncbi:hypothetical protein BJ322DRAFT_1108848 [Thelephora terrestris]|uniref:Uncharacterized protein n=1 Tax=Thelephora terrestris TaxID=56493 RepID=A0A9P6L718_9AGAM|nr:hypothetical protein BJ322DRAFT_1108848 [Thelephora terrestris]
MPEQTKEEYVQLLTEIMNLWTDAPEMAIHSIIETPGTVVAHLSNKVKTSIGVEMIRESMFVFRITADEDGALKITQIDDFTDTKSQNDWFKAIAEAKAKRERPSLCAG